MAKRFTIYVHSIEGDTVTLPVSPEEQLEAVFRQSLTALEIPPTMAENYFLVFNGVRLDLHQSVGAAGITEGSELILSSQPQVGT